MPSFVDFKKVLSFISNYIKVVADEYSEFMIKSAIATLPSYLYPQHSTFTIYGDDSDDSSISGSEYDSDESCNKSRDIVVFSATLTMVTKCETYDETIAATQLLSFADEFGIITFNELSQFYPEAVAIEIVYYKKDDAGEYILVTQSIDLLTRTDMKTGKKCTFGRIQL